MKLTRTRWLTACGAVAAASIAAAGCSSSSSGSGTAGTAGSSGGSGGNYAVTAGVLHAFTGQNAFFGLNAQKAIVASQCHVLTDLAADRRSPIA